MLYNGFTARPGGKMKDTFKPAARLASLIISEVNPNSGSSEATKGDHSPVIIVNSGGGVGWEDAFGKDAVCPEAADTAILIKNAILR